jgi:hypothetical protein
VSDETRHALAAVAVLLGEYGYTPHAAAAICRHVAIHGCLAGAPGLDACDESDAEAVFVAELPEVPYDSPAWDREDVVMDRELLVMDKHPWPIVGGPDDDRAEPFEPSEADWAALRREGDGEPMWGYE